MRHHLLTLVRSRTTLTDRLDWSICILQVDKLNGKTEKLEVIMRSKVHKHTKQEFKRLVIPKAPPSLPRTTPMRISASLTSLFTLRAVDSHSLQTWEDLQCWLKQEQWWDFAYKYVEAVIKIIFTDGILIMQVVQLTNIMPSNIYLSIISMWYTTLFERK